LRADRLAAAVRRLSQPKLHRGVLTWLEGRPQEGGRQAVVAQAPDGTRRDLTPSDVNVRSLVHEYGGGDYGRVGDTLVYAALGQPGIQRLGAEPVPATLPDARYADFVGSPDGRWLLAVEEHVEREGAEPRNRLVGFDLARGERRVVCEASDFVASPAFSPNGTRLAFLTWDHPRMPWDGTELRLLAFGPDGPAGSPHTVAGGERESVFQPAFSPGGHLTFVSDRSGWWNLYQLRGDEARPLCPRPAEFGLPQWVFGMSTYGFASEDAIVCIVREAGVGHLARLSVSSGKLEPLQLPFADIEHVRVTDGVALFLAAGVATPTILGRLDLAGGDVEEVAAAFALDFDPETIAPAEAVAFPTVGDREAHAFLYRPRSAAYEGPAAERPPLVVKSHGGPTGATGPALKLGIQYWTSRGFAVLDVNYGGSTGYGRSYRERLDGAWGVVDVDDCTAAAVFAAEEGVADPARLAITGGSAGGYTTLACLTFRDVFAVGTSHYGIGDLEALARDTHKFESRYLDGLIGPWPERSDLYRERSPVHHCERLSCPVAFFQGLEDRVVPPNQAEAMVAALASRGIRHLYVPFEGEQHGFRRAENIQASLEGELWFYGQILGFDVDSKPALPMTIRGAAGG
jgi:dipeptidyl aminopeptidase/acylaminoacyl peptidase